MRGAYWYKLLRQAIIPFILFAFIVNVSATSPASDGPNVLNGLRNNAARVTVTFHSGEVRHGIAIAVGEHMNGILFVTPNSLVRDLNSPDNPTARISISYFSTKDIEDEAVLLENSDSQRNVAVLLAQVRLFNMRFIWDSQGCRYDVKKGTPFSLIGRKSSWFVDSTAGQFSTAFADGRAMTKINGTDSAPLGTLVVVGDEIVGIIERQSGNRASVIDVQTIQEVLTNWSLPWELKSLRPCVDPTLAIHWLYRQMDQLPALAYRIFRPGKTYFSIYKLLNPTEEDFRTLYELSTTQYSRSVYEIDMATDRSVVPSATASEPIRIKSCQDIEPGYRKQREGFKFDIKQPVRYCVIYIGTRTYTGFWYVNGHWIWLPTS